MRAVIPYGAIISCVGGWKLPARRSCVSVGSASHTTTRTPSRASASAHINPVGPAPAITTGRFGDIATILETNEDLRFRCRGGGRPRGRQAGGGRARGFGDCAGRPPRGHAREGH